MTDTSTAVDTPPRLTTAEELDRLRQRWDRPAFAGARDGLLSRADEALAADLRPVAEAGGWGHGFFCPDHVVQLEFDPAGPAAHRCPVDGRDWSGPDFDGGWRCALNGRIQSGLQACAMAWRGTGDRRYLDYAREILLDYADRYPDLPESGRWVGKGKVTGQSLEEAAWAIGISRGYDLIRDALSAEERRLIEERLLRGLSDFLTGQLMGKIHNIECWHLAALADLGAVLDDAELVRTAVDGEFGLTAQFADGILEDGWWAEGSPHYHYYMLSAALAAAMAVRRFRPEFLQTPGLAEMLSTPLSMMRDDFSLPALNDGWNTMTVPLGVGEHVAHYEQGYGLWRDDRFARFLADMYGRGIARTAEAALTLGPELDDAEPSTRERDWPRRTLHRASGYAILAEPERYLLLKYGPHGGGHGHPDKLQIDLHAFGVRLAPDAGSPAYTSPLQGPWVRQTLSHNTVLLDHTSQPETEGRLIAHRDPVDGSTGVEAIGVVDAVASWPTDPDLISGRQGSWLREPRRTHVPAYAGATIRRTLLWLPGQDGYLLDLVGVTAPDEVPIDLAWHHRGRLVSTGADRLTPITDWAAPNETYGFLRDLRELRRTEPDRTDWQACWEVEGAGTRIWAHDQARTGIVFAASPSNPPAEDQVTTLRRTTGRRAVFVSVLQPYRVGPAVAPITGVDWSGDLDGDGLTIDVRRAAASDSWRVSYAATGPTRIERIGDRFEVLLAAD